jgi:hypothetical protein
MAAGKGRQTQRNRYSALLRGRALALQIHSVQVPGADRNGVALGSVFHRVRRVPSRGPAIDLQEIECVKEGAGTGPVAFTWGRHKGVKDLTKPGE